MAVALAAPLITAGASLLGSWFGKSAADKAAEAEQQRIDDAIQELNGLPALNYIQNPEYQYYDMPEEYKYQTVGDSAETRAKLEESLGKLRELRDTGLDTESERQFLESSRNAGNIARGRTDAALNALESRGMGTSGLNLLARLKEAQDAADRVSSENMAQASAAAQGREQANRDYAVGMGNLRAQDINLNKTNADIINEFNRLNTKQATDTRNANTMLANKMKEEAVSGQRQYQDDLYERALNKAKIKAGYKGQQSASEAQQAANKGNWYSQIGSQIGNVGQGVYDYLNNSGSSNVSLGTGTSTPTYSLGNYTPNMSMDDVSFNTQPGSSFISPRMPSGRSNLFG